MPRPGPTLPQDPLSRAYRDQVDATLLRKNLGLTVEERLDQLQELLRFAEELRRAGRALRGAGRR
jgi:hypothetical protein